MDRTSVPVAVDFGFDSESGQTNDLNIAIHSFLASRLALKGQCGVSITTTTIVYFFDVYFFL